MRSVIHASQNVVARGQVGRANVAKCGMWLSHRLGQLTRICTALSGSRSSSRWTGASTLATCSSYALVPCRVGERAGVPRRFPEPARFRFGDR